MRSPSAASRPRNATKPSRGSVRNGFACIRTTSVAPRRCASAADASSQPSTAAMRCSCSAALRTLLSWPGTLSVTNSAPPTDQRRCSQYSPGCTSTANAGAQNTARQAASRAAASLQSSHSLSPGMRTNFCCRRANWRLRAASHASLQPSLPLPMSPPCTTKSSRSRFMSSIRRSSRSTSDALYGVSPITPNTRPLGGMLAQLATSSASTSLNAVGLAQEGERMRLYSAFRRVALPFRFFLHPLHDVARGDRAVGAHEVRLDCRHLPEHRPADLHRALVILGLHAPGAVVSRAALDHRHLGARNHLERFARLLSHVLHARVAGDVIGDL